MYKFCWFQIYVRPSAQSDNILRFISKILFLENKKTLEALKYVTESRHLTASEQETHRLRVHINNMLNFLQN